MYNNLDVLQKKHRKYFGLAPGQPEPKEDTDDYWEWKLEEMMQKKLDGQLAPEEQEELKEEKRLQQITIDKDAKVVAVMKDKLQKAYPKMYKNLSFWVKEEQGRLAVQMVTLHDDYAVEPPAVGSYPICKVVHKEISQLKHFNILPMSQKEYEMDSQAHLENFNDAKNMGKSDLIKELVELGS